MREKKYSDGEVLWIVGNFNSDPKCLSFRTPPSSWEKGEYARKKHIL